MTRRGTTNSTGNLGGGVFILVKNGLIYYSLSTQHLSSLDPCSNYSAITVKIKGASPIHLFNLYVPPSALFLLTPVLNLSHLLPSFPTTFSAILTAITHPGTLTANIYFDRLLSSDQLLLNNPDHPTLQHRPLETVLFLIFPLFLPPLLPNVHGSHFQTSVLITFLYLLLFLPPLQLTQSIALPHSTLLKPVGMTTFLISTPTAHLPLALLHSLSEATYTFTKLLNNTAASTIPFGNINRPAKAWWSPEIAEVIAKRRKAFERAHCSEKDRQNYVYCYLEVPYLYCDFKG